MSSGKEKEKSGYSRREFIKFSSLAVAGFSMANFKDFIWTHDGRMAIPVSRGYILVDPKKCQGCLSCMLACSLVHEGIESLSLARIQVLQNSYARWPDDIMISQCRQCKDPLCADVCPVDAISADAEFGYVRMVDKEKCIGCGECTVACPHTPSRACLLPREDYSEVYSRKCDLCADTPFWNEEGGPKGKQACVEVCPVGAIAFTSRLPRQRDDSGYQVNLRDRKWGKLGYPTED